MDAQGDHNDSDDILRAQFFMQQDCGKNHPQNRNQCVVNGDLADRMNGKKRIINSKADSGDCDQAQQDKDTFSCDRPGSAGTCQKPCRDEQAASDLHTVTCCTGDIHFPGDDPCDQPAEGGAASIEQDHAVSPECDIGEEIFSRIDVDGDNGGNTQNAA